MVGVGFGDYVGVGKNSFRVLILFCLFFYLLGLGKIIGKIWDESEFLFCSL